MTSDDSRPLVETKGVDQRACGAWREIPSAVQDELVLWSRTHKRAHGSPAGTRQDGVATVEAAEDADPTTDWDREDEAA